MKRNILKVLNILNIFNFLCFVALLKTNVYLCDKDIKTDKSGSIISSESLLKNILQHSPKVSEAEIEEREIDIIKRSHEEEYKTAEKLHMCIKDYSHNCPKYWKEIEKNGNAFCVADSNYNGFCEIIQSFDNFTENDKINFETSCNVEWPCKNEILESCKFGRDYIEPCPEGFILQPDNSCKADTSKYNGYCISNNVNFIHMTNEEKEQWSIACEAFWPCYEECEGNRNLSKCPKNWKQENNSFECIPNATYNGPCKNKKAFTYFTNSMKKEFEEKCKTRFECIEKETVCEIDYDKNCPENWTEQNGTCLAPPSFDLCNKKKLSIENTTVKDKQQFEKECSVKWPCKQSFCEMDWQLPCPDGWIQTDKIEKININKTDINKIDKYNNTYPTEQISTYKDDMFYFCKPPTYYKGKCDHIILHKDSDDKIKRELASSCNAPWSCIDKKNIHTNPETTKVNLNEEAENGPITSTGNILRSSKYKITEEESSHIHDIMK